MPTICRTVAMFESNRIESNRIESNRIESNRIECHSNVEFHSKLSVAEFQSELSVAETNHNATKFKLTFGFHSNPTVNPPFTPPITGLQDAYGNLHDDSISNLSADGAVTLAQPSVTTPGAGVSAAVGAGSGNNPIR